MWGSNGNAVGQDKARDYYREECRMIIGCAMEVLNCLGH